MARKRKYNPPNLKKLKKNVSDIKKFTWNSGGLKDSPILGEFWYPGMEDDINNKNIRNHRELLAAYSLKLKDPNRDLNRYAIEQARPKRGDVEQFYSTIKSIPVPQEIASARVTARETVPEVDVPINPKKLKDLDLKPGSLKDSPLLGGMWYPGIEKDIKEEKIQSERDLYAAYNKKGIHPDEELTRKDVKRLRSRRGEDPNKPSKVLMQEIGRLPEDVFKEEFGEHYYEGIKDALLAGTIQSPEDIPIAKALHEQGATVDPKNIEHYKKTGQPKRQKSFKDMMKAVGQGAADFMKDTPGSFEKIPGIDLQPSPLENQLQSVLGNLVPQWAQQAQTPQFIPQIPYASQLARGPLPMGQMQRQPQQPSNMGELLAQMGQSFAPIIEDYLKSPSGQENIGQAGDFGLNMLQSLGLFRPQQQQQSQPLPQQFQFMQQQPQAPTGSSFLSNLFRGFKQ